MSEPAHPAPQLAYGTIDTQFGVVCEDLLDGGVVITIPSTTWGYVARRTPPSHPIVIVFTIGWYFVEKLRRRPLPPRAPCWRDRAREPRVRPLAVAIQP